MTGYIVIDCQARRLTRDVEKSLSDLQYCRPLCELPQYQIVNPAGIEISTRLAQTRHSAWTLRPSEFRKLRLDEFVAPYVPLCIAAVSAVIDFVSFVSREPAVRLKRKGAQGRLTSLMSLG